MEKRGKQEKRLEDLVFFRRDVTQDLINIAIQDPAKIIQRRCGDRPVLPQFVNGGTGYMMPVNQ